ncbi:MAG TPA: hypothetical protein VFZ57_11470, partial [Thermoanaerobaculia bacterium]|nr:hypothetical protein [Thermoanaerobaculia bacterium]
MGPDAALWFTEFKGSKIGRIVPPAPLPPARLCTVAPCRVVDTRNPTGPFGGPALLGRIGVSAAMVYS